MHHHHHQQRKAKLVGLTGLKGSGKDTAAAALVTRGWTRLAFADALYIEVAEAFSVSVDFLSNRETKETPLPQLALEHCKDARFVQVALEHLGFGKGSPLRITALREPRSPRFILQIWGTEYRRQLDGDDYWRRQVEAYLIAHSFQDVVITDVRFPDEGYLVEGMGGEVDRIVKKGLLEHPHAHDASHMHSSERAMLDYHVRRVFFNHEGEAGRARFIASVLAVHAPNTVTEHLQNWWGRLLARLKGRQVYA